MIYTKTCEYAIRALIYFVDHSDKQTAKIADVSKDSGVPSSYVAKIFQCLVRARILSSQRGPSGGYALKIAASKLSILHVVQALDDLSKSPFSNCIMGLDKCNDRNPCPLHPIWARAKEHMLDKLASTTIADMAELGDRFSTGKHSRLTLSKQMREIFSGI